MLACALRRDSADGIGHYMSRGLNGADVHNISAYSSRFGVSAEGVHSNGDDDDRPRPDPCCCALSAGHACLLSSPSLIGCMFFVFSLAHVYESKESVSSDSIVAMYVLLMIVHLVLHGYTASDARSVDVCMASCH
jgi:hypothetical protein